MTSTRAYRIEDHTGSRYHATRTPTGSVAVRTPSGRLVGLVLPLDIGWQAALRNPDGTRHWATAATADHAQQLLGEPLGLVERDPAPGVDWLPSADRDALASEGTVVADAQAAAGLAPELPEHWPPRPGDRRRVLDVQSAGAGAS